jgi:hypothetical protein
MQHFSNPLKVRRHSVIEHVDDGRGFAEAYLIQGII